MKRKSETTSDINKRRKRSKSFKRKKDETSSESVKAEVLDAEGLIPGMVLLGCVTEVRPSYLCVSLPGCVVGKVPITHISEKYTELLVRSNSEEGVEVPEVSSLVEIGATCPCQVLKVNFKDDNKRKPFVSVSIDPRVINADLRMQSLYHNMVLHASVISAEDHGYIVELGVPGVQGFIPTSASNGDLTPGQIIRAVVTRLPSAKDGNVAWLRRMSNDETVPEIEDDNLALSSILPGAKLTAYVTEVTQPFIYMKCMSFDACANMMSLGAKQQDLTEATTVTGTVLYVHPVTHLIYLHLGPLPTPTTFPKFFRHRNFDFAKNVRFQFFWHHRMLFGMGKGAAYGFVKRGSLAGRGFLSQDALEKNPVIPKARVTFLHYMDNLIQLSLSESTINMEVIKPEEVQVGDIYECTVSLHVANGMFVAVCPGLSGFVRQTHLSDALVTQPEKLFPVGSKVKCRVLCVEGDRFQLTSKESLLALEPENLLMQYDQVHPGDSYKGVVVHRTDRHMVVVFFNGVKGIVYTEEIPESSVYFVGQTVSCRVLECLPQQQKLKLSLRPAPIPSKVSKSLPKKKLAKDDQKVAKSATANKSKENEMEDSEPEENVDPTKKHKAMIQSHNRHQLNVVLRGGKRGRVHVTEIGIVEEGTMPLKGFKPFQSLRVHVLGSHIAKARNFLKISHRHKIKIYQECAMEYPPPTPLDIEYHPGMEVVGYVKEVSKTSCTLWLSPIQAASLDYLHFSENPKELRKLKKILKPGLAVKATVLEVEKVTKEKETYHNITLTRINDDIIQPGRNIVGLVQIATPEKGVVLKLPFGHHGTAGLCDLRDAAAPLHGTFEKCRKLLYVPCHVIDVNEDTGFCVLSLRKSRLYGVQPEKNSFHPELTRSQLEANSTLQGYIKSTHPDHLLVNFGRGLDGCVKVHSCNTRGCVLCKETDKVLKRHVPGEVVKVRIGDVKAAKGLYTLSMPELDGMGVSEGSRLSVAEDINWEDV